MTNPRPLIHDPGGVIRFCLVLIFLAGSSVYAQYPVIKGIIVDSANQAPVPFATVYLGPQSATITDEQGTFSLALRTAPSGDTLKISCVGYTGKKIPLEKIYMTGLNTISIARNIFAMDEVVVTADKVKLPGSKKIVEAAAHRIPMVFPADPVLYKGYYREYLKEGDDFINLFESILNLKDFGQASEDSYLASLDYKRLNDDFKIDSSLFRTYDNREKYVPLARVHLVGKNELSVLMSTNPVKYAWGSSVSFIDNFRTDFVKNHVFDKPMVTRLDGRPFYVISFEDKMEYHIGSKRVKASGTIYIDAVNLGIKKINYLTTLVSGTNAKKLYELTIEYALRGYQYYLNYISYNNLFRTSGFVFNGAGIDDRKLLLAFSRDVNTASATARHMKVFFDDKEQEIDSCETSDNRILVSFEKNSDIVKNMKGGILSFLTGKNKTKDILARIRVEFDGIKDKNDQTLSSQPSKEYYQYREFFVHETIDDPPVMGKNLVKEKYPVFENAALYTEEPDNIDWFNSPLIRETLTPKLKLTQNPLFNHFILAMNKYGDLTREETAYIHTDREVYAPGDTLWFKAYVRNETDLTPSYLSKRFFIQLTDSTGEAFKNDIYLLDGPDVNGQIAFPPTMKEGYYLLTGYSSWMKNSNPGDIYKKRILIQKEKASELRLQITYDKESYLPGDSVHFIISCLDEYNRKFSGVKFDADFEAGQNILFETKGETSASSDESFSFVIPKNIESLPVVNIKGRDTDLRLWKNASLPLNYFVDVEFFPEGGHYLDNEKSDIAFKAVTRLDYPMDITGEIVDRTGKIHETVSSIHDGMGKFTTRVSNRDSLFLRILTPEIFRGKTFRLPEARESGWQMSVQNKNHSIRLEIISKNVSSDTLLATLIVRGKLCYYEVIPPGDEKQKTDIPVEGLPAGIAVVTLFNKYMIPQNERLVLLNDPAGFTAEMSSNKEAYGTREAADLEISLPDNISFPQKGSWSLSIVDNQLCMTDLLDEPSMTATWLLSPEIKGKIHHLNDYIWSADGENTWENIDLLLLTQGWRDYTKLALPPGKLPVNKDIVSGTLMKQPFGRKKQPAGGTLNIFYGGTSTKIPVDETGRFSFLPAYDAEHNSGLFLNAMDKMNTTRISIELDMDPFDPEKDDFIKHSFESLSNSKEQQVLTYNRFKEHFSYSVKNHQWLEEVVITKQVKPKDLEMADLATMKRTAKKEDIENAQTMEDLWFYVDPARANSGRVTPFYRIDGIMQYKVEPFTQDNEMTYRISNVVPDYEMALHLVPQDIEKYTIIRDEDEAQALYGFGFTYVIDIKLKPISERSTVNIYENPVMIRNFTESKVFYHPKYDTDAKKYSQVPDLRKTIYWNPDVNFNNEGKSVIRFYNGDRYTRIRCILEGIDDRGTPVHSEYMYDVELF